MRRGIVRESNLGKGGRWPLIVVRQTANGGGSMTATKEFGLWEESVSLKK